MRFKTKRIRRAEYSSNTRTAVLARRVTFPCLRPEGLHYIRHLVFMELLGDLNANRICVKIWARLLGQSRHSK